MLIPAVILLAASLPASAEIAVAPRSPIAVVREIEMRSDAPIDNLRALERLITVEVGQSYDVAKVRDSIRNLSASAQAGEVAAFKQPLEGGVRVIFALWRRVEADSVELEGTLHFDRTTLLRLVPQQAGSPLLSGQVVRGSYQLEDYYHEHGYFEARVRVRVDVNEAEKKARVVYQIASGPQATLGKVKVTGSLGSIDEHELVAALKLRSGRSFHPRAVDRGQNRLRRWLIDHEYRLAEVGDPRTTYDRANHEVNIEYPVRVGPKLVVAVSGADRATLERKGLLPFLGEEGYDEALLLQAVDKIKTYFQESGHYRVKVETEEERVADRLLLTIKVEPGAVYDLEQIKFVGNNSASTDQLTRLMTTSR
ncbi:MAG TPA: POTRA domain-containing protein, partial [Thermoanaerobaculia bacterium]|nr:POTRA domain-containing protein [Thermoanaerobaculia bacterium]